MPVAKDLEKIFIFLLIFIVNVEDVVEPALSIMTMIGGCLDTCYLVTVSSVVAMSLLKAQVFWGRSHSMFIDARLIRTELLVID